MGQPEARQDVEMLKTLLHDARAERDRYREALAAIREERHHWCQSQGSMPGAGCTCGKARRDKRIDAALARGAE